MNYVNKLGGRVPKTAPSTAASKAATPVVTVADVIAASRLAPSTPASPGDAAVAERANQFADRFNRGGSGTTPPSKAAVEAAHLERVGEWSSEPLSVGDVIAAASRAAS